MPDLINQERQCRTAADVAKWLSGRGPRVGHPCGPDARFGYWGYFRPNMGAKYPQSFGQCELVGLKRDGWGGWGLVRG